MMLKTLGMCGIPLAALLLMPDAVRAQHDCYHCQRFHCPPALKHCLEGAPRIHFHRGCPKPICNPCQNPNWGYFEPCWNPWPWPPDYSHCRTPPPASAIVLNPGPGAVLQQHNPTIIMQEPLPMPTPIPTQTQTLPAPRTLRPGL
jgi:hypothetical protein